ncbi:hypothetical protein HSTV1_5 [Haloarcula sinaiiensis tailed virus 1]|uniref:Uncharacterized protein n=1 Tax=Haloarcula sinaiiensis tailed virus 1 TaxID=1262530 RepID=R9QTM6_9CAUD|nr:hypothetical protein HSTV1_5 [Haloarcula sinaiiensis tailed virus 1]AGC34550.1 hypothetical protein HSTV1_5 [Haloarcula sinaiiensis tailed virus 1]
MSGDNWKTLRVPPEAYDAAKEQKEANDRTWGEQIVRQDDPADNADVDTEALAEELQERINYPEQQDTETIVQRLEDLETRLPSKVARELQQ